MDKTVSEAQSLGHAFLKRHGVENSLREARFLLSFLLQKKENDLLFDKSHLSPVVYEQYCALLQRVASGEPIQQVVGYVDFLDCTIEVNRHVLIPRQETELLAALVVQRLKSCQLEGKTLLDLCTGSGCLAIAIKSKLPKLHVIASDISKEALDLARKNAKKNGVPVEFLEGDFLSPLGNRKVDFVVSNPPYISRVEYEALDKQVLLYEPKGALLSGETGLEFYARFQTEAPLYLNRPAKIFFEIGTGQGERLQNLFSGMPWKNGVCEKDFASHDRFFSLEIE